MDGNVIALPAKEAMASPFRHSRSPKGDLARHRLTPSGRAMIRRLLLLGLLMGVSLPAEAQEYLVNGDFHNGAAAWNGDTSVDSAGNGIAISLNPNQATRVYQTFTPATEFATCTLTCTPSADCEFTGAGVVAKIARELDSGPSLANPANRSTFKNVAIVIVPSNGGVFSSVVQKIDPASPVSQTVRCLTFATPQVESTFYIAFPPGKGSITLNEVSLTRAEAPHAPPVAQADDAANVLASQT